MEGVPWFGSLASLPRTSLSGVRCLFPVLHVLTGHSGMNAETKQWDEASEKKLT